MKKIILGMAVLSFLTISAHAAAVRGPNVHFDTDKAIVLNEKTLEFFAHSVKNSANDVRLYCHTDSRASKEHNMELASKRCDSTKTLLEKYGVEARSFIIVGEESPEVVEEGRDLEGRMGVNRRVEIYYEIQKEEVIVESGKFKRHRVTIAGGYAPSGLDKAQALGNNTFRVKEDWDLEFGASYSYRFTRRFNVGVAGYTNKSGFLHLGLDF